MNFRQQDLNNLKNKVHNVDDLKSLAKKQNLSFSEDDLKESYQKLNEPQELDLDSLNEVSGGLSWGKKDTTEETTWMTCKCGFKMEVTKDSRKYTCPKCNRVLQYQKKSGC